MQLRTIQSKDDLQIAQLIQNSLKERGFDRPGTAYFDPQLNHLTDYYQSLSHARYWVIEHKAEIIGGAGIAPLDKLMDTCELQKLYVADSFQRMGLASRLMNTALDFARQYYEACYLETHTDLGNAWSLYEKFGFKLLETPLIESEHTAMDRWYYKKLTTDLKEI